MTRSWSSLLCAARMQQAAVTMTASNSITVVPPQIDAFDWEAQAERMGIPHAQREEFIWWLRRTIENQHPPAKQPGPMPGSMLRSVGGGDWCEVALESP